MLREQRGELATEQNGFFRPAAPSAKQMGLVAKGQGSRQHKQYTKPNCKCDYGYLKSCTHRAMVHPRSRRAAADTAELMNQRG